MASIYGLLGLDETKTYRITDIGEQVIYTAVEQLLNRYNTELAEVQSVFVEGDTTAHQLKYVQPGYGMMQEGTEWSRPGAVKSGESYTVGFGLRDFRDQIGWNDVSYAYATVQHLDMLMKTVMIRHTATVRFQIMKALFNNTTVTYDDPEYGDTLVYPLANGDATRYIPKIGSTTPATANHYLGLNIASIGDAMNPLPTMRDMLLDYKSDAELVVFASKHDAAELRALTAFVDVADPAIRVYQGTEAVPNIGVNVPGKIIGRVSDVWVVEWRQMPDNYLFMADVTQPGPLMRRLDSVQLPGRGQLALIATQEEHPVFGAFFRDRFGYGSANRLNGVVGHVAASASYTIPTAYA